jgi:predicted metal-dependent phosphoesterase TrpH
MPVDLHVHTAASDGSDPPAELVAAAAHLGLEAVAITDHDTLEGIEVARAAGQQHGIEVIPGTELSLEWPGGTMHLVVLFLEPGSGPLQDRLGRLLGSRSERNLRMVQRLRDLGIDITIEEVLAKAGGESVGRPHMAAVLVDKGVVPDIATAFERYLGSGRPAYEGRDRLAPEEAVALARQSGAVPVLAHPHTLGIEDSQRLEGVLRQLHAAGLVGLECLYGAYEPEQRQLYSRLAQRVGLVVSGGSDYHGSFKEGILLGVGRGDLEVPGAVLDELRAARTGV